MQVLLSGSVRIVSEKKGLDIVVGADAGAAFGEGALLSEERRAATVTALQPCHLLLLSTSMMDELGSLGKRALSAARHTLATLTTHSLPTKPKPHSRLSPSPTSTLYTCLSLRYACT